MIIADIVFLVLIAVFLLLGLLIGFGKGLRFFTRGIFGFLLSIVICYLFGGLIYNIPFVQSLLTMFIEAITGKNAFCDILIAIRIDIIVYYIALFIIIQIIRAIIVLIVSKTFEIENAFIKALNRIFGAVLFLAELVFLTFIVFQIIYAIGGDTAANFAEKLDGSKLFLNWLYENNPLLDIVKFLFQKVEIQV